MSSVILEPRAHRSHYFLAFRAGREVAYPLDVAAFSLDEALEQAKVHCNHKDGLVIHEVDEGRCRQFLHNYVIRQKKATYRKDPITGLTERVTPLKPDHVFSIPVDSFLPKRPFDAFKDNPVGVDRNLVEHRS